MGIKVPNVTFKTRVLDSTINGPNPYKWKNMTSDDYFRNQTSVVFSLPGAFTPTCSNFQVPAYNDKYEKFMLERVDNIYCISVNDAFVMNKWKEQLGVTNIKFIPDGNGEFTDKMGYLVEKKNLGFGLRSWRYSMFVIDSQIIKIFEEPGMDDNVEEDPYEVTDPTTMLNFIKEYNSRKPYNYVI